MEMSRGNFLDGRGPIAGVGPITVVRHREPRRSAAGGSRRARPQRATGRQNQVLQSAFHNRSLSLHQARFETRETKSKINGAPLGHDFPGYDVRSARATDLAACKALCQRVHGHHRGGELDDAIKAGTACIVEHLGQITAYATGIAFFAHAVAETNQGLKALIGAAPSFGGGGFLLPTRNGEMFRWCLQNNLRLVHQMTLMTIGLYNEPTGPYVPSVLY